MNLDVNDLIRISQHLVKIIGRISIFLSFIDKGLTYQLIIDILFVKNDGHKNENNNYFTKISNSNS